MTGHGHIPICLESLERLNAMAQRAGEAAMRFYGRSPGCAVKADGGPATAANGAAHDLVTQELRDWDEIGPGIARRTIRAFRSPKTTKARMTPARQRALTEELPSADDR